MRQRFGHLSLNLLLAVLVGHTVFACSDDTSVPLVSCTESVDCPRPQYCHYGNCQPLESIDEDGDGIPEEQEALLGLDPNSSDTDGDGKSDLDEVEYDPYARVFGSIDRDGDGISDAAESSIDDEDNDGYPDEVDPCNSDPDCPTIGGQDNDCSNTAGEVCVFGIGACEVLGMLRCGEDSRNAVCVGMQIDGTEEVCDGIDNDCDGQTDEDFGSVGSPCTPGVGLCRTQGTIVCTSLFEAACSVTEGTPTEETCDTQDNDCDGRIDETFELGAPCESGEGECRREGIVVCDDQQVDTRCLPMVVDDVIETCDNQDNDCDGLIDEGFEALGTPCEDGSMACVQQGVYACNLTGDNVICSVETLPPGTERCNEIDDDCDGNIDEDFDGLGDACDGGVGACAFAGVIQCGEDGLAAICSSTVPQGTAERCNEIDDDCDGNIDEDFASLGSTCTAGVGACEREGTYVCAGVSGGVRCTAIAGFSSIERCNGIDDDCDGNVDEGFEGVGEACETTEGSCRFRGVTQCRELDSAIICIADEAIDGDERCDNLDNDCDGNIDEGLAVGSPCDVNSVNCERTGQLTCANDGTVFCSADALPSTPERCDGADNDCDGRIDEDFPRLDALCSAGVGECTRFGTYECALTEDDVTCNAVAGDPAPDDPCDGLDNDCNGTADDEFPTVGNVCFAGDFACTVEGRFVCGDDGDSVECNAQARPPRPETCNNVDDNCDGAVDETFPDKGQPCEVGLGECRVVGRWVCGATGDVLQCQTDTSVLPIIETCDDLDNDCDGNVDEDFTVGGCRRQAQRVSAAGFHTCFITHEDTTSCFGDVPGQPPAIEVRALAGAGENHCVITLDNRLRCWGDARSLQMTPLGTYAELSVGRSGDGCALELDTGLVKCWGNTEVLQTPPLIAMRSIAVGDGWACGIERVMGGLQCWGRIPNGTQLPQGGSYSDVDLGGRLGCAINEDQNLRCFGEDSYNVLMPLGGVYSDVSVGPNSACALNEDGQVFCWGLGSSDVPHEGQGIPPQGLTFRSVSVGSYHVCGIRTDGGIECWGAGAPGQTPGPFNSGQASPP